MVLSFKYHLTSSAAGDIDADQAYEGDQTGYYCNFAPCGDILNRLRSHGIVALRPKQCDAGSLAAARLLRSKGVIERLAIKCDADPTGRAKRR
jgi:hypothetical protein